MIRIFIFLFLSLKLNINVVSLYFFLCILLILGAAPTTYDYGYGRTQTYDTSKTYYQQAGTTAAYNPQSYDTAATAAAKVVGYQTATYAQPPRPAPAIQSAKPTQYNTPQTFVGQTSYSQTATTANASQKSAAAATPAANTAAYSNYDAALYSAATMYVAQQTNKTASTNPSSTWNNFKKQQGGNKQRMKPQPKPQTLHYCEVCKISCAGPQTYREHLDGQKHKKREASLKMTAAPANVTQNSRGNSLHCELCDVTCTGNDAYAAHVRGAKHQKVFKLHQKLGKPIPPTDPASAAKKAISFVKAGEEGTASGENKEGDTSNENVDALISEDDIKPVGVEYIEEMKDEEGKIISFNCKLCECKFNDPNAKEMHMKGRRHRLQYKKKVQPDLVVDFKPNPRHRRFAEAKAQRVAMQEEYWNRRRMNDGDGDDDDRMMWDRRGMVMEDEYMNWRGMDMRGGNRGRNGPPMGMPFFNMMAGRRPESSDDRHVVHRHAEIYPKEEELQTIQRIVSHTERALKFVSDALTDVKLENGKGNEKKDGKEGGKDGANENKAKEDGRDNQLFSFQKEAEGGNYRILKGVMRVGLLAKGMS